MTELIEWTTEEPQAPRTVKHWLVRCNTGDAITSLASGADVTAWLKAAPEEVRREVLIPFCPPFVGRVAEIEKQRDAAMQDRDYWQEVAGSSQIERLRKREPTREEADGALGDAREGFLDGWIARRCLDCGCWVFGGPTRCVRCAERIDRNQARTERDAAIARAEKAEKERDVITARVRVLEGELDEAYKLRDESLIATRAAEQGRNAAEKQRDEMRSARDTAQGSRDAERARAIQAEAAAKLAEGQAEFWEREAKKAQSELAEIRNVLGVRDGEVTSSTAAWVVGERNAASTRAEKAERERDEDRDRAEWWKREHDRARTSERIAVQESIAAERTRREQAESAMRDAVRNFSRVDRELTSLRDQTGHGHDIAQPSDLPLAPGSRWDGMGVESSNGTASAISRSGLLTITRMEHPAAYCLPVADVLAQAARAGLLPVAGVPRKDVSNLLSEAILQARNGWKESSYQVADHILADYDREKGSK